MPTLVPVILAGGSGTRLWPISREAYPKQLLRLPGEELTLLQQTALRLLSEAPAERILTVGAAGHDALVRRQLLAVHPDLVRHRLLEPVGRNTAAAVALAALFARDRIARDAVLWVCPSDHVVSEPEALLAAVETGLPAAAAGELVTFGIGPTRPETGYGYIQAGAAHAEFPGVLRVQRFVEKPPRARAEAMLAAGGHFWNAGIFLFRADRILAELGLHEPAMLEAVERAAGSLAGASPDGYEIAQDLYRLVPSAPIDKAVMERSERIAVVPCQAGWSDLGSWQAYWERLPGDDHGNASVGPVVLRQTSGCLVQAESRLVACAGVQDLAVIETADAVLVADRSDPDAVRDLVGALRAAGREEAHNPAELATAFGVSRELDRSPSHLIRQLTIDPGAAVLLREPHPAHWLVLAGAARVVGEGVAMALIAGGSFDQAADVPLEIENRGAEPLCLIEHRFLAAQGAGHTLR